VTGDMEIERMDTELMIYENYTKSKVSMPWAYTHINYYMAQLLTKKEQKTITFDELNKLFTSKKWSSSEHW